MKRPVYIYICILCIYIYIFIHIYVYITCCYWFVRNRANNCRMTGCLVVFKRKARGESHVQPWRIGRRDQTSTLSLTNQAQGRPVASSVSF